jgi:hypothetical protein
VAAGDRRPVPGGVPARPAAQRRLPHDQPLHDDAAERPRAEYTYPRWFFSSRSADIRGLFCEYCERLGIRWTQSNPRNISVSHRRSVALLGSFVPAKS